MQGAHAKRRRLYAQQQKVLQRSPMGTVSESTAPPTVIMMDTLVTEMTKRQQQQPGSSVNSTHTITNTGPTFSSNKPSKRIESQETEHLGPQLQPQQLKSEVVDSRNDGNDIKITEDANTGQQILPWAHYLQSRKAEDKAFSRKFITIQEPDSTKETFSVVTYNILADSIVDGSLFVEVDTLKIVKRLVLVFEELSQYNADILCIQEIEAQVFKDFFSPEFKKLGYDSEFSSVTPKVFKSNKSWIENRIHGCAMFWKRDIFVKKMYEMHDLRTVLFAKKENKLGFTDPFFMKEYLRKTNVLTIAELAFRKKRQGESKSILVGNVHIAHKASPVQIAQARASLYVLEKKLLSSPTNHGVIFCGDFNSIPSSAVYKFIREGQLSKSDPQLRWANSPVSEVDIVHPFALNSVYGSTVGEPQGTTAGLTLDYIWYSADNIKPTKVLEIPPTKSIKFMSDQYPSDHVALFSEFEYGDEILTMKHVESALPKTTKAKAKQFVAPVLPNIAPESKNTVVKGRKGKKDEQSHFEELQLTQAQKKSLLQGKSVDVPEPKEELSQSTRRNQRKKKN